MKDPNIVHPGSDLTNVFPEEGADYPVTDWHKILVAYISHVYACEGAVHFPIYIVGGTALEADLTEEERSYLSAAVDEALKRSTR